MAATAPAAAASEMGRFAAKTLPTRLDHLRMAERLAGRDGAEASNVTQHFQLGVPPDGANA